MFSDNEMARKEFLKSVLVLLLVLLALMSWECQRKTVAEARILSKACVPNQRCHVEIAETQERLDVKEDIDHEDAPGDDYGNYRQYGDVPSPGIGH